MHRFWQKAFRPVRAGRRDRLFNATDAVEWRKQGKRVILVREETNPEDVEGMRAAEAILTARGGMTSHAALVARGWGKCCIVGCGNLHVDDEERTSAVKCLKEGDWITLNGTKGNVYAGKLPMMDVGEENQILDAFLKMCSGSGNWVSAPTLTLRKTRAGRVIRRRGDRAVQNGAYVLRKRFR